MDKYEIVLDIIEHPDRYTPQELEEILSDPETMEIYRLLSKADSAVEANMEVDVEAEWSRFAPRIPFRRRFLMRGNRAASIAVIICTSIVAVAAGIAVSVAVSNQKEERAPESVAEASRPESGISSEKIIPLDTLTPGNEAASVAVLFEDEPLSLIMSRIAAAYGVDVRFDNDEVAQLHLYYTFDSSLPLEEIISQLNSFESIDITINGNTLIID